MLRILALLVATLPTLMAHPGHHEPHSVLWHVLSQGDHLVALLATLALALGGGWWLLRRRAQAARDRA